LLARRRHERHVTMGKAGAQGPRRPRARPRRRRVPRLPTGEISAYRHSGGRTRLGVMSTEVQVRRGRSVGGAALAHVPRVGHAQPQLMLGSAARLPPELPGRLHLHPGHIHGGGRVDVQLRRVLQRRRLRRRAADLLRGLGFAFRRDRHSATCSTLGLTSCMFCTGSDEWCTLYSFYPAGDSADTANIYTSYGPCGTSDDQYVVYPTPVVAQVSSEPSPLRGLLQYISATMTLSHIRPRHPAPAPLLRHLRVVPRAHRGAGSASATKPPLPA